MTNYAFSPLYNIAEVGKMEFIISKRKKQTTNMMMPVSLFLVTLGLSLILIDHTSVCFVLPILLVALSSGYLYVFIYLVALAMTLLFVENSMMTQYISLTGLIVFYLLSYFHFFKTKYMPLVLTAITAIFLYVFHYTWIQIGVISSVTLMNSYLYLQLVPIIMHNKADVYTPDRLMIISIIVLTMMTSLMPLNVAYMMILIRFYLLITIYYLTIQTIVPAIFYVSILLILMSLQMQNDVLALILPLSFYLLYQPKNKYIFTGYYLLSHIILPFFITYQYQYYTLIIVISAGLFVLTPQFKNRKIIVSDDYHDMTKQNRLMSKADSFAALFQQLTDVFMDNTKNSYLSQYIGYVYEDVCSHCSSCEYCFYSKDGVSRLGKLLSKGMKEEFKQEDLDYIQKYCVDPINYQETIKRYRRSYENMMKVENANRHMRKDLFKEFSMISHVFSDFSKTIQRLPQQLEKSLIEHLKAYQFDIVYLKKHQIDQSTYTLEIGLRDVKKSVIEEELIPILENFLNHSLEVLSIYDHPHYLGYTSIVLKHQLLFHIQYGYQQFSLDQNDCGDSYCSFHHDQHFYMVLSDGMGQGLQAAKESRLALEIFTKLIKNGIELKDTLRSLNSLLKIKNQGDMYTTLDFCDFDLVSAKLKMIKYGAFESYVMRDHKIETIKACSLPMGMASKLKMMSYEMKLCPHDIIILVSDGVGNEFIDILERNKEEIALLHPSEAATLLMSEVLTLHHLDDMSIIVLKVEKNN